MLHHFKCTGVTELLRLVDRADVADRGVITLVIVVAIDPEGQVPDQLLGAIQDLGIIIKAKFVFKEGEEALHHSVISAAALGRHAAADLVFFQQLPLSSCPLLAPPNRCRSGDGRNRTRGTLGGFSSCGQLPQLVLQILGPRLCSFYGVDHGAGIEKGNHHSRSCRSSASISCLLRAVAAEGRASNQSRQLGPATAGRSANRRRRLYSASLITTAAGLLRLSRCTGPARRACSTAVMPPSLSSAERSTFRGWSVLDRLRLPRSIQKTRKTGSR